MKFIVRKNCEYSLAVEAATPEDAYETAQATPLEDWDTAWSPVDTEQGEEEE